MVEKRKCEDGDAVRRQDDGRKKIKKGFTVGPANLPDGAYKRKNQEIKASLIERAQIKKEYAKLKRQGKIPETKEELPKPASAHLDEREDEVKERDFEGFSDDAGDENPGQSSAAPHPDRQTLMDREEADPGPEQREQRRDRQPRPSRERKPKHKPFEREHERANKRKEEAEARRKEREERERQREEKIEQRERIRKAMAKARAGGRNGQRRLGRESNVLLEKVKMMVGGK